MNNDIELMHLLRNKETREKGFELLIAQYGEKLYWQVRRMVLNHEDANDILQNALIKAWTKIGDFQNRSNIYTWLSRIAINESLDFLRSKKNESSVDIDEVGSVSNRLMADEYFDGDETQAMLHEAVSKLPNVQRAVFTLRYFEEMKYADMSRVLGTSEGALKASYHQAVKKIEDYFNNHN